MTDLERAVFAAVYGRKFMRGIGSPPNGLHRPGNDAAIAEYESNVTHSAAEWGAVAVLHLRGEATSILEGFEGTDIGDILEEALGD
jgi:hypothetical protein